MPLDASRAEKNLKRKKVININNQKNNLKNEAPLKVYDPEELIFALDIGTRTIVGIVGVQEKDKFKVLSAEIAAHKNRAMLDGQIHDIKQVADTVKKVKEKLEKKIGMILSKVAIAAAGRVLKTCEVRVEREIEAGREIDQELIGSIEIEGIQQAQVKLDLEVSKDEKTQFYCVGYSVINYYLNGYVISTLIGHKGKRIGADVLATFLPHIVVDSLYTVMSKIGLEVISLTLEPIAAINVTIPKDLRMLNLALVDIGAGTSDIAITKDGSVAAYAMVPIAGDEITERIAQHYLVDFNTGENIKILLVSEKEDITFVDILGKKHTAKSKEVIEVIRPAVELLAENISKKILEYNGKAPNAVFLIGGGCQIPGLTVVISEQLKLSKDRVVVRGREIIQNVKFSAKKFNGPEAITPLGIAVTAMMQKGQDFLTVTINGGKVRLFNSKRLTVADALILVGFNPGQLIGRTGKNISFELRGEKRVIRGEYGKAAEIYVNEKSASLGTFLKIGDDIRVNPAEDGRNAEVKASDFIYGVKSGKVVLNGTEIDISPTASINGNIISLDNLVSDGDKVEINEIITIMDLMRVSEIDIDKFDVIVNGKSVGYDYNLNNMDIVECKKKVAEQKTVETLLKEVQRSLPVEEKVVMPTNEIRPKDLDENEKVSDIGSSVSIVINGKVTFLKGNKTQHIFVDLFNYIDFDLSKPQGNIVLKLNGEQAAFTDVIRLGDVVDIYWEKN